MNTFLALLTSLLSITAFAQTSTGGLTPDSREEFRRVFGCHDCGDVKPNLSYFASELVSSHEATATADAFVNTALCRSFDITDSKEVPVVATPGTRHFVRCMTKDGHTLPALAASKLVSIVSPSSHGLGPDLGGIGYATIGLNSEPALFANRNATCVSSGQDLACDFGSDKQKSINFAGEIVLNGEKVAFIQCRSFNAKSADEFDCSTDKNLPWAQLMSHLQNTSTSFADVVISNNVVIRLYKDFGMNVRLHFAHDLLQSPIQLQNYKLDSRIRHELTVF